MTHLIKPTQTTIKSPSPLPVLGSSPVSPYSFIKMIENLYRETNLIENKTNQIVCVDFLFSK
jgi:hypothetical protein